MPARFVVDNSVVMAWCFGDEGNSYAEAVLESLDSAEAFVPVIWPLEVGNVLLVAERKKRLAQAGRPLFRSFEKIARYGGAGNSRPDAQGDRFARTRTRTLHL